MRVWVAVDAWMGAWDVFFFQAEDGIRDLVRSRGLGDVYKRQLQKLKLENILIQISNPFILLKIILIQMLSFMSPHLSLIHI